jgi:hypothetical protein
LVDDQRGGRMYADVSRAGTLTGISGITQGLGLDIQLQGKFEYRPPMAPARKRQPQIRDERQPYYKVTPGLTGTLTVKS